MGPMHSTSKSVLYLYGRYVQTPPTQLLSSAIEFAELLPRLAAGVIVHVHDISFPNTAKWGPRLRRGGQHEQFCLQALLTLSECFDPLFHGAVLSKAWLDVSGEFQSGEERAAVNKRARMFMGNGAAAQRPQGGPEIYYDPDGSGESGRWLRVSYEQVVWCFFKINFNCLSSASLKGTSGLSFLLRAHGGQQRSMLHPRYAMFINMLQDASRFS